MVTQPRHAGEEPLVGGFAQGQEEEHVVGGDVEALGEGLDVGGHQGGLAGLGQREADVGDGDDLAGEVTEAGAGLVRVQRAHRLADEADQRAGGAWASAGSA